MTTIYIKNMVCPRCVMLVKQIFEECGVVPENVALGVVTLNESIAKAKLYAIGERLQAVGFELIEDRRYRIVNRVKTLIISILNNPNVEMKQNLSEIVSSRLNMDYGTISSIFSQIEGKSIEKYYILVRIELAKELLISRTFTLSEIAYKLGFSSVAHLSTQFKQTVGMSPSVFKSQPHPTRVPLDEL